MTHDPVLKEVLAEFDAFCHQVRLRLIDGHARYGSAWRSRNCLGELMEESADAFAYGFFDWLKAKRRKEGRLNDATD